MNTRYFHSAAFFRVVERTPYVEPYMVWVEENGGNVVAHLMALLYRHISWLPFAFNSHGRIYGDGDYTESPYDKECLFGIMLRTLTRNLCRRMCLYIEVSDTANKMFGYRNFRRNGFFSIPWQEIHNSLHSKEPEKRLSDKARQRILNSKNRGVYFKQAETEEEHAIFFKLLKSYFRFNPRRHVPLSCNVQIART